MAVWYWRMAEASGRSLRWWMRRIGRTGFLVTDGMEERGRELESRELS